MTTYELETVLAAAYAADRVNNGFTGIQYENAYEKKFANRTIIRVLLHETEYLDIDCEITKDDFMAAEAAKKCLPSVTMKILNNTATDFETKIYALLGTGEVQFKDLGLCAYIPKWLNDQNSRDEYRRAVKAMNEQTLVEGDKISGKAKVLSSRLVTDKYVYSLDFGGLLISFWSNKVLEGEVFIERAKVKQITPNFVVKSVQEAQLNYVKVKE
jgi:hypothetical protein